MSYTINGYGHGAEVEKVKAAFAGFVHVLDEATSGSGSPFQGNISGTEYAPDGTALGFTWTSEQVRVADKTEMEAKAAAEPPGKGTA